MTAPLVGAGTLATACPKPERTKPKARKPIPRGGKPNAKRKRTAAETREKFAREFHSEERIAFVASLPCCACGAEGRSENAHVGNKGAGQGRKADYDQIAPLCRDGVQWNQGNMRKGPHAKRTEGCHRRAHRLGQPALEARFGVDLLACAEEAERAWRSRGAARGDV